MSVDRVGSAEAAGCSIFLAREFGSGNDVWVVAEARSGLSYRNINKSEVARGIRRSSFRR